MSFRISVVTNLALMADSLAAPKKINDSIGKHFAIIGSKYLSNLKLPVEFIGEFNACTT
jgi:hypothetical protein